MYRRLGKNYRRARSGVAGNLWLRSDLRRDPAPALPPRPESQGSWLTVLRKPLTWILTGALLLTTAAAGQAYLAADPANSAGYAGVAPASSQETFTGAASRQSLEQLGATQQALAAEIQQLRETNRGLINRLETLQAAIAPEATATSAD